MAAVMTMAEAHTMTEAPADVTSVLHARDISVRYPGAPAPVLQGFDLAVAPGEFIAIVGGSGVGKSTLLRVIAGLLPAESGELLLDTRAAPSRRRRGIVFQDGRLMPWRTLEDNISYGLEGLALSSEEKGRRLDWVTRLTGLDALRERYPHELSGGQVQRAGIARALAVEPDILLMDEPFSAVDAITRETLQDELLGIWEESGKAVLFVTHDIAEAVLLADRVVVLSVSPAGIALDLAIDMPRPRARGSDALAAVAQRVAAAL